LCLRLLCHLLPPRRSRATAVAITSSGTKPRAVVYPTAALRLLLLPPKVKPALLPITIGTPSRAAALRRTLHPRITRLPNAKMGGPGTRTFTRAFRMPRPLRRRLLPTRQAEAPTGSVTPGTSVLPPSAPRVLTRAPSPGLPPTTTNALTQRSSSSRAVDVHPWDKAKTAPPSLVRGTSVASRVAAQFTPARLVSSVPRMVKAASRSSKEKNTHEPETPHRRSPTHRSLPPQSFRDYLLSYRDILVGHNHLRTPHGHCFIQCFAAYPRRFSYLFSQLDLQFCSPYRLLGYLHIWTLHYCNPFALTEMHLLPLMRFTYWL